MATPCADRVSTPRRQDTSAHSQASLSSRATPTTASMIVTDPSPIHIQQQQQLYRTQSELLRCRTKLAASKEELNALQQQLAAAVSDGKLSQQERDATQARLRLAQEAQERSKRESAAAALANVTLAAERDDLAEKVREAWERVASLGRQLAAAEAARDASHIETIARHGRDGCEACAAAAAAAREAQREAATARAALAESEARCFALDKERSEWEQRQRQQQQHFQKQEGEEREVVSALATVATMWERVRGAGARWLLPLDGVPSDDTGLARHREERAQLESAIDALEHNITTVTHHAQGSYGYHRPLVQAVRACLNLLEEVHTDALRVAAERAHIRRTAEAAEAEARRLRIESAQSQRQREELRRALDDRQRQAAALENGAVQESLAARAALAATLGCAEDWSLVRHRVQHAQQQLSAWEHEAQWVKAQIESARTAAESEARRAEADHRAEVAALTAELRSRSRELASVKDAYAALQLGHQYGSDSRSASAAAMAATAGELERLRRVHTTLQATHKAALHSAAAEPQPSSAAQEQAAEQARAEVERLSRDKEQLYSIIDMLRGQLRELRTQPADSINSNVGGSHHSSSSNHHRNPASDSGRGIQAERARHNVSDSSVASGNSSARRSGTAEPTRNVPSTPRPLRHGECDDGDISRGSASLPHAQADTVPQQPPVRQQPHPPPGGTLGTSRPLYTSPQAPRQQQQQVYRSPQYIPLPSTPYPIPVLPTTGAPATATATASTAPPPSLEEALEQSIQLDRREGAYAAGSVALGGGHTRSPGKFASEVLGVIEALDRRVTGALQRRGRRSVGGEWDSP